MTSILAAVDPRHEPARVLREAFALAHREKAQVTVLHVVSNPWVRHPLAAWGPAAGGGDPTLEWRLKTGADLTTLISTIDNSTGLTINVCVEPGRPESVIVETAESLEAAAIVIGAPERRAEGVNGTIAERVVQHAHCPVLAVRESPSDGPVLAATDLSDPSLPAIAAGARLAAQSGVAFVALHVVDTSQPLFMPGLAESLPAMPPQSMWTDMVAGARGQLEGALRMAGVNGEALVSQGWPVATIIETAATRKASLVVVGTIGASGLRRLLLGSVARDVLREAPCSVWVVRLRPTTWAAQEAQALPDVGAQAARPA